MANQSLNSRADSVLIRADYCDRKLPYRPIAILRPLSKADVLAAAYFHHRDSESFVKIGCSIEPVTSATMTPLRRRLLEDMGIRKLADNTQGAGLGPSGFTPISRIPL